MFVKGPTKIPIGVACAQDEDHGTVDGDGWDSESERQVHEKRLRAFCLTPSLFAAGFIRAESHLWLVSPLFCLPSMSLQSLA